MGSMTADKGLELTKSVFARVEERAGGPGAAIKSLGLPSRTYYNLKSRAWQDISEPVRMALLLAMSWPGIMARIKASLDNPMAIQKPGPATLPRVER